MRRIAALCVLCLLGLGQPAAAAQNSGASGGPRFDIKRYVVDGATLIPAAKVRAALEPYTGRQRDFNAVQNALKALEKAYADAGYTAIQVVLPEQELRDGEVRLQVRELKIGKLTVEGNKHFDEANVRRSLPALAPGVSPNVDIVARNLRTANESPAKNTTVLLRTGEEEGTVDAVARVVDQKPWRGAVTLDSTGTPSTGMLRLGFSAQHANLFNRDQVLSAQYITSPAYPNRVSIVGLGYHVPLYGRGDSLDFAYVYSDVDSGLVTTQPGSIFGISGSGQFYSGRYNLNLPRRGNWDQKFVFGVDWREFSSNVFAQGFGGPSLVSDITVHPASAGYVGRRKTQTDDLSLFFTVARNIPGGPDGDAAAFARSRTGAHAAYTLWRVGGSYLRVLPRDWQARVSTSAQFTADRLVPGEQFGLGGMDSVRGFLEREIANDRGIRSGIEIYTPDLNLGADAGFRSRALAFFDYGYMARNGALPNEIRAESISSFGLGLRAFYRDVMSLRIDFGRVHQGGGLQNTGDMRLQGTVSMFF